MATRIERTAGLKPRIIMDCTHTWRTGAGTGIQRVVRRFADALLEIAPSAGLEVIPARIENGELHPLPVVEGRVAFPRSASAREAIAEPPARLALWRARGHALNRVLRSSQLRHWLEAGPNENGLARLIAGGRAGAGMAGLRLSPGDVLLSLDSSWVYDIRTVLERAGRVGVTRVSVLCDVLPLTHPDYFTEGTRRWFGGWLEVLLPRLDGVVTISEVTRAELAKLAQDGTLDVGAVPPARAVHLGAELEGAGSGRLRAELEGALAPGTPPSFITVGTLEPRKNVGYAIDMFEALLARGLRVQWHVIGAPGWLADETARRIESHPQRGKLLHWWRDLSDPELLHCYRNAAALVAVSKAEGFGLPLVEARLHGTPVFASDIPVFREVLANEGRYLPLGSAKLAAAALEDFLAGRLPMPVGPSTNVARSWLDRGRELLEAVLQMHDERAQSSGSKRPPT